MLASTLAFLVESAAGACTSGQTYARYVIAVHVVTEDFFQMLLYTLISASQVKGNGSISAAFGVIQCIIFFLFKAIEVFKLGESNTTRPKGPGPTAMI